MMSAIERRAMHQSPAELAATGCREAWSVSSRSKRSGSRPQAPCLLTDESRNGSVDPGDGGHLENPGWMSRLSRAPHRTLSPSREATRPTARCEARSWRRVHRWSALSGRSRRRVGPPSAARPCASRRTHSPQANRAVPDMLGSVPWRGVIAGSVRVLPSYRGLQHSDRGASPQARFARWRPEFAAWRAEACNLATLPS
jgi:hypothetical protein